MGGEFPKPSTSRNDSILIKIKANNRQMKSRSSTLRKKLSGACVVFHRPFRKIPQFDPSLRFKSAFFSEARSLL